MKMTGKLETSEDDSNQSAREGYLLSWGPGAVDEPITEDLHEAGRAKDGEIKDLALIPPSWILKLLDRILPPVL